VSNLRMAVVRLDQRTAEVVTPDGDLRREFIGAALNLVLIERYGKESLVFGGGPLTGTLAPASALLVGSFMHAAPGAATGPTQPAPSTSTRHVPLLLTAGPDFRCSGIDHLVVLGAADRPTLLHIDGSRVRFVEPPQHACDLPAQEKALRRSAPPFRSVILTSSAADAGVSFASVSLGVKGSLDKAGLAGAMAAKNLKGILLGGSGGIGFAAEDLRRSLELAEKIKAQRKKVGGFASLVAAAGGGDCLKALKGAKLRDAACFHCPAPCMVHARFTTADPRDPQGPKQQNGVLLMDPVGWIALARKRGEGALPLLAEVLRLGLDPSAVAALLPGEGKGFLRSDIKTLSALAKGGSGENRDSSLFLNNNAGTVTILPSSSAVPAADPTFGGGLAPIGTGDEARRITALAFVLGVCPLFLLRFPQAAGDLPAFLPAGVSPASLDRSAERVLAQG
jgi:hypothetical protein